MSFVIMSRLRSAIWPLHEHAQTAGPLGGVLRKTCAIQDYKEALVRMHGFTAPAERMIKPHIDSTLSPLGYEPAPRLGHLEKDLMFLGYSSDQL